MGRSQDEERKADLSPLPPMGLCPPTVRLQPRRRPRPQVSGPGSAGSGKSNSIAWTAHQLSSLYDDVGEKVFHSVIVVTDRTVLDDQLQDTIYQFEHADGVVGRSTAKQVRSKSEKLAAALEGSQPIIIVTIQTFPHVLKAIENSVSLKKRNYATYVLDFYNETA